MKREFIVERQGRAFVMYAGLLNLAHESGLQSIHTELIQAPTAENRNVAICTATVRLLKDGCEHTFTGIGDAAENNVGPAMKLSLIRMAETRAKARALRDAVNVGVSAFEELNESEAPEAGSQVSRPRSARAERSAPARTEGSGAEVSEAEQAVRVRRAAELKEQAAITPAQVNAIRSLCRPRSLDANALVKERYQAESLAELSSKQAGELIRSLTASVRARTAVTAAAA